MKQTVFWGFFPAVIIYLALFSCTAKNNGVQGANSNVTRIVVLSPEVAEIIAALGAGDKIIGITDECDYPVELQKMVKVGKFGNVNKEIIISLKPDMVFTSALEQDALTQELRKLGLRIEQIYPRKLSELPEVIKQIGRLIGEHEASERLAKKMNSELSAFTANTQKKDRPKVYLEIYRDPLMSVSDASYVGELIETAGGDNIFSTLERDYARIEAEDVVKANPEVIICYSQDTMENILKRKGWQDIPAIRNKRVYFEKDINPDWILRASPRSILGIKRIKEILDLV